VIPRTTAIAAASLVVAAAAGCRRSPNAAAGTSQTPATVADGSSPAAPADMSSALRDMTQALRRFSFEQKRFPTGVDELVTATYMPAPPAAPPGMRYVIDTKNVSVVLGKK
jgi:hypothetical protein